MFRHLSLHISLASLALCSVAWGQATSAPANDQPSMPGMDMSHKDAAMGNEKADNDAGTHAMHSMEGHMDMGPHMKMTALRPLQPGDASRAQQIAEEARRAADKYKDYHVALADGFKIFLPNVPQKMYHFTNYANAGEAEFRFNPDHPTSLLYEKRGEDYKLIGVMYTAPKHSTEEELDARIPLSIAQWHEHVNFCSAPAGRKSEMLAPNSPFGLHGSIQTQEACDAAGGTFRPVIFNWMVHIYPFEKDQANIWSVERQHGDTD